MKIDKQAFNAGLKAAREKIRAEVAAQYADQIADMKTSAQDSILRAGGVGFVLGVIIGAAAVGIFK